jgi:hypothetical protein
MAWATRTTHQRRCSRYRTNANSRIQLGRLMHLISGTRPILDCPLHGCPTFNEAAISGCDACLPGTGTSGAHDPRSHRAGIPRSVATSELISGKCQPDSAPRVRNHRAQSMLQDRLTVPGQGRYGVIDNRRRATAAGRGLACPYDARARANCRS